MKRTEWLQKTRKMRLEEAYEGWRSGGFIQEEAAMGAIVEYVIVHFCVTRADTTKGDWMHCWISA